MFDQRDSLPRRCRSVERTRSKSTSPPKNFHIDGDHLPVNWVKRAGVKADTVGGMTEVRQAEIEANYRDHTQAVTP